MHAWMRGCGEIAGLESGEGKQGLEDRCYVTATIIYFFREKATKTHLPMLAKSVSPGSDAGSRN